LFEFSRFCSSATPVRLVAKTTNMQQQITSLNSSNNPPTKTRANMKVATEKKRKEHPDNAIHLSRLCRASCKCTASDPSQITCEKLRFRRFHSERFKCSRCLNVVSPCVCRSASKVVKRIYRFVLLTLW
jgi:hypothetical protein